VTPGIAAADDAGDEAATPEEAAEQALAAEQSLIDEITATGLFDSAYYAHANPDVVAADVPPLVHYVRFGMAENRRPNAYFDPLHYAAAAASLEPDPALPSLLHYRRVGESAGIAPGPFFDPQWYRAAYGIADDDSPLADFLAQADRRQRLPLPGFYAVPRLAPHLWLPQAEDCFARYLEDSPEEAAEGGPDARVIAESGIFDANYYLINGLDVHALGLEPIRHFCRYGWREGRSPNIYFAVRWYLQTNPGVAALGVNPVVHYLLDGEAAGRRPIVYFDPLWYRNTYRVPKKQSALAHYLAHRRSQRFAPNPEFDLAWYLRTYGAQVGRNRDPFSHYLMAGTYGDVRPSPSFDWPGYRRRTRGRRTRHFPWTLNPSLDNPLIHKLHAEYR
jgi:hypothetical protein